MNNNILCIEYDEYDAVRIKKLICFYLVVKGK